MTKTKAVWARSSRTFPVHKSYGEREDLQRLAVCNNINGPIAPSGLMTLDDAKVTCKRCLRIIAGKPIAPRSINHNHRAQRARDHIDRTLAENARKRTVAVDTETDPKLVGTVGQQLTSYALKVKFEKLVRAAVRAGLSVIVDSDAQAIKLIPTAVAGRAIDLRALDGFDTVTVHGACGGGSSGGGHPITHGGR